MSKLRKTKNNKLILVLPIILVICFGVLLTYSFANFKSIKTLDIIGSYFIGNSYTLSYDNPGCTSKTIKNGKNYGELCAPTYTGYTFNGWLNGNTLVSSSDVVRTNQDITLTADKTANQYNVFFNQNINYAEPIDSNLSSLGAIANVQFGKYDVTDLSTDDILRVSLVIDYSNLTVSSDDYMMYIQCRGNNTGWGSGSGAFNIERLNPTGTGQVTINKRITVGSNVSANDYFQCQLRADNYASGSIVISNFKVTRETDGVVSYDNPYGALPTLSKTNYIFEGWNGKNKFDINNDWVERQGGVTKENNLIAFDSSSRANNTIGQLRIQRYYNSTNMTDSDNLCFQSISSIKANRTYSCRFTKTSDFDKIAIRGNTQYYDPLMAITTELTNGVTYVLSYDVEEVSSDETLIKLKNIQIEEDIVTPTYEPYIISSTTPVTQAKDHILTAKWNQLYDNYLSSKPGFTVEECTANYNNNRINVTLNASNTANLGSRVIFNKKNTQGGVLHLKGTMTVNANSGVEKAKIEIHLGSTSRGNDLGSYVPVREISRGTTVTFDEKVAVPNNAYITIAIGRDNTNYQGSLYGSVTFTDFYIAKN